jgi:hypothetical protein
MEKSPIQTIEDEEEQENEKNRRDKFRREKEISKIEQPEDNKKIDIENTRMNTKRERNHSIDERGRKREKYDNNERNSNERYSSERSKSKEKKKINYFGKYKDRNNSPRKRFEREKDYLYRGTSPSNKKRKKDNSDISDWNRESSPT